MIFTDITQSWLAIKQGMCQNKMYRIKSDISICYAILPLCVTKALCNLFLDYYEIDVLKLVIYYLLQGRIDMPAQCGVALGQYMCPLTGLKGLLPPTKIHYNQDIFYP